ncbi:MAG: gamma-butyrobetaine hydroxylase-like domain-containing protein [Pseudomonadota bacterium]
MSQPTPTDIRLHQQSRVLEVAFDDGSRFEFPCEFLRVFSPSAEVQGHGPGQERLQWGKKNVNITSVQPVGNYAVQLYFDDGHDTGIYSWDLLYRFGVNQDEMWQDYLAKVEQSGVSREPLDGGTGAVDANAPYRGGDGG